jgi:Flp pilus assembly protein TadD
MHRDKGGPRPARPEQAPQRAQRDRDSGSGLGLRARLLFGAPVLGLVVLLLAGCPQRKSKDEPAAAPQAAPAISSEERSTLFANLARLRLREGDAQRAIDYYRTSVDLSPENPHWYLGLAEAYTTSGQTDLADEARSQAARIFKSEGLFVSAVALD